MNERLSANELQERAQAKGEPEYLHHEGDANRGDYLVGLCPRCKQPITFGFTNGGKLSPCRTLRLEHTFTGDVRCEKEDVLEQIKGMTGSEKMEFFIKRHDDAVRAGAGLINVIINGRTEMVCTGTITYEKIAEIAKQGNNPSVMYRHKVPFEQLNGERDGLLIRGQSVPVTLDMVINAMDTSKA